MKRGMVEWYCNANNYGTNNGKHIAYKHYHMHSVKIRRVEKTENYIH